MIAVLAGGVGAARFLRGLCQVVDPSQVTVIGNTGDDLELYGLHVSPDLDTVVYTTAGAVNATTGWGLVDESVAAMTALRRYGVDPWFTLGDRDLATHLYRTSRLRQGATLSQVTAEIAQAWDLSFRLVPMTDDVVRTRIVLAEGREVDFQEYFVHLRHAVPVQSVRFDGVEHATAAPGVLEALRDAQAVILAPSNPILSLGPILAIDGVARALHDRRESVVAISPIVNGVALKGPADRLLSELGYEPSVVGVARIMAPHVGALVVDTLDGPTAPLVAAAGVVPVIADTVMSDLEIAKQLARVALGAAGATADIGQR